MGVSSTDIVNLQASAALFRSLPATITRAGSAVGGTVQCRVLPGTMTYQPVPGSALLRVPTWTIFVPPGTDVRQGDTLTVTWPTSQVRTYGVGSVLDPRSFEIERWCFCYLLSDSSVRGGAVGAFLPTNAVVNVAHQNASPHYTNRAVYLEFPSRMERIMAAGAEVPALLADLPDTTYQTGDVVTVLSVAGHSVAPHPQALRVGLVERLSGPPPLTSVELTGLGGYA